MLANVCDILYLFLKQFILIYISIFYSGCVPVCNGWRGSNGALTTVWETLH